MSRLWGAVIGVLVPAASLVATSGAALGAPSGDTCSATGNGTAYTVVITLPAGGAEQGGFAFGAPGATVTSIAAPGTQGALSTQNVPANTTAAWLLTTPVVPGASVTASLVTSGPVTGSFTVIPANAGHTTYFDAIVCQLAKVAPISNRFTVQQRFAYNSATGTWHAFATVPGRGTLIYNHRTLASKGTPRPLIQSGRVSATKAGKVKLTLRPTAAGRAALKKAGSIRLNLSVEFSPKGGKPANKVVSLTLRK